MLNRETPKQLVREGWTNYGRENGKRNVQNMNAGRMSQDNAENEKDGTVTPHKRGTAKWVNKRMEDTCWEKGARRNGKQADVKNTSSEYCATKPGSGDRTDSKWAKKRGNTKNNAGTLQLPTQPNKMAVTPEHIQNTP